MSYSNTEIRSAKVGTHTIQFQPGCPSKVVTVTKVSGDFVTVELGTGSESDQTRHFVCLNRTASRKLIEGQYRG